MVRTVTLIVLLFTWLPAAALQLCAFPGRDGDAQARGVVNLWLASTPRSVVKPGSRWLPLDMQGRGQGQLDAGDLALVVQMQGAQIDVSNDDRYGDGIGADNEGRGWQQLHAGHFEFVRVEEVRANKVRIRGIGSNSGVLHEYRNVEPDTAAQPGRQRWQLVRVPQYENLTLSADINVLPWDGTSGGVLALDVRRTLQLNGHSLSVAGAGFRGGAALPLVGALGEASDYRYRAPGNAELAAAFGQHASKGEGLAGTPRWLLGANNQAHDSRPQADRLTLSDGYPHGSMARGAPANAGGGASSLSPDNNVPAGGGGGGGGSQGEDGRDANGAPRGGLAGAGLAQRVLLTAGGGGGAGSRSFGQGVGGSGGAGGGIIVIRAGRLEGEGQFDLRGQPGLDSEEGGGGGGAGGTMLLQAAFADQQTRHWLLAGGAGGQGAANGGAGGAGRVLSGGGLALPNITAGVHFDQLETTDLAGVSPAYLCRPAGMLLLGQVFEDNGEVAASDSMSSKAIAHDGRRQRGELGLAQRAVRIREGAQVHAQGETNNAGLFALELPESLADRQLTLEVELPAGWQTISAKTDDLPLSPFVWQGQKQGKASWQFTARREYLQGGIALGLIRTPQWQTPDARTVTPGSTQLFLFRYLPHTSGRVRFRYRGEVTVGSHWRHNFFLDPECNQQSKFLDEDVSRWLPVQAEQPVCVRVRVDVPEDAPSSGSLGLLLEAETDLGDTPLKVKLAPLEARIEIQLAH